MSWWETLHLVTWWKRLGISAIKTGQDAPSWIWCTERLSFFGGGHIVLQRFVHVRCHFQPLPTKLVFAYFDRGSYVGISSFLFGGWPPWWQANTLLPSEQKTQGFQKGTSGRDPTLSPFLPDSSGWILYPICSMYAIFAYCRFTINSSQM